MASTYWSIGDGPDLKWKCHSLLTAVQSFKIHHSMKPLCRQKSVFVMYLWLLWSPRPISSNPLRRLLGVSMCLEKTAFYTNWSQWHKLQGRMNKLCLHGNTYWQECPLRSLQCSVGIAVYTPLKPFIRKEVEITPIEGKREMDICLQWVMQKVTTCSRWGNGLYDMWSAANDQGTTLAKWHFIYRPLVTKA